MTSTADEAEAATEAAANTCADEQADGPDEVIHRPVAKWYPLARLCPWQQQHQQ